MSFRALILGYVLNPSLPSSLAVALRIRAHTQQVRPEAMFSGIGDGAMVFKSALAPACLPFRVAAPPVVAAAPVAATAAASAALAAGSASAAGGGADGEVAAAASATAAAAARFVYHTSL